jgi:hypothetical protein
LGLAPEHGELFASVPGSVSLIEDEHGERCLGLWNADAALLGHPPIESHTSTGRDGWRHPSTTSSASPTTGCHLSRHQTPSLGMSSRLNPPTAWSAVARALKTPEVAAVRA